jgi:hypothetical protein
MAEADAYLVGPGSLCADGDAGFAFFMPDGWYANRRVGESPACRMAAPFEPGQSGQPLETAVTFSVLPEAPIVDANDIESLEHIELPNGIGMDRIVSFRPESRALAAEHSLTCRAAPGAGGGRGGRFPRGRDRPEQCGVGGGPRS